MTDRSEREWFELAFDDIYAEVYAHRDLSEAELLVDTLRVRFQMAAPVLDIACGPGRLLQILGRRGFDSIGLDLSRDLLRRALESGAQRLVRADMRRVPLRTGGFNAAFFLFTSFGYFDRPSEDRVALSEAARCLRPGGLLVLDYFDPDTTLDRLVPESRREINGIHVRERRWIDPSGPFLRKRVQLRPGVASTVSASSTPKESDALGFEYEERLRIYDRKGLERHFLSAGLRIEEVWGDYQGGRSVPGVSDRLILIGRKSAEATDP